ncbi:unnamed protein product [Brachionus calyciflorus]|uniref:Nanos-type domain-containing protein n=1 Tax=Brachionus calyciflorus TaxID=104777 RepID=A0A814I5Q3_9BILA|nr:unnamed protein product [Brachionus calyciflorus]
MSSYNKCNENTILVAGLQQYVLSIKSLNYSMEMTNENYSANDGSSGYGSLSPTASIYSSSSSTSTENSTNQRVPFQVGKKLERPSEKIQIDVTKYIQKSSQILNKNPNKVILCTFCKNNREPEHIFRSHSIKDIRGRVTCPLLKEYKCPACGESGENAHTITYCKKLNTQKRNELLFKKA